MNATLNQSLYFPEIPMIGGRVHSGILTKMSNNENDLRTKSIEGTFDCLPVEGTRFVIWGKALTKGMQIRMVSTSSVEKLSHGVPGQSQVFITETGTSYRLDYVSKEEE